MPGSIGRTFSSKSSTSGELLPGRLLFCVQGTPLSHSWSRAPKFSTRDIEAVDFRGGKYSVPHYPEQLLGAAIGPLSVDQTVRFCFELRRKLEAQKQVVVECVPRERCNTAVLLGAFLIVDEGWTVQDLQKRMPLEGKLRFPCPWQDPGTVGRSVMTVGDCWAGLAMASSMGWLQVGSDSVTTSLSNSMFWRCVSQYDGSWLVPGKVFVMADPVTVLRDPNPNTYSKLTPDTPKTATAKSDHTFPQTPCTLHTSEGRSEVETQSTKSDEAEDASSLQDDDSGILRDDDSVHSVCKVYNDQHANSHWPQANDLVSFLQGENVVGIVRANTGDEPGIKCLGGSYKPADFQRFGLRHLDVAVDDTQGALPRPADVAKLLRWAEDLGLGPAQKDELSTGGALAFHCKSGFGRSVVLACCFIIFVHDVPGRALLGWSRIARPGAITNVCQERFLQGLTGRSDLMSFTRGQPPRAVAAPAQADPACCTLQ